MNNRGITLRQARSLITESLALARGKALPPLSIVVLDSGAHLKAMVSEDGVGTQRYQIALGKAHAALGMGFNTRQFYQLVKSEVLPEMFAATINGATGGEFIPLPGGVLIVEQQQVMGAIGISGASSDLDEWVATNAISKYSS
ncbi:hypothetical protein AHAT_03480 [Agarivorans sp. Toyoura001]|uniref:GlcG/HbpS family heme-binding protein n=1 Tax=Agarivorans sp. Toyoura001 TaxID=2283141 RepID=UPI0010D39147|nr:heme-binding protein [Agarivorans sp. Toyoura001]GDY24458.1 hypothetical protein AHAT_03480 [Agarivorans sp. Toyoura001]